MKRTNIHLSKKQLIMLSRLSDDYGISKAELVRRAIDDFVDKRFNQIRINSEGAFGITGIQTAGEY